MKRKREDNDDDDDDSSEEEVVNDEVRLYEAGFKDRYYESKFDVSPENKQFRYKVGFEYVRGLCWVLHYYYQVSIKRSQNNDFSLLKNFKLRE